MVKECLHDELEFLGEQKGEEKVNRYYKCLKCGCVLVRSENGTLYEILKGNKNVKSVFIQKG